MFLHPAPGRSTIYQKIAGTYTPTHLVPEGEQSSLEIRLVAAGESPGRVELDGSQDLRQLLREAEEEDGASGHDSKFT